MAPYDFDIGIIGGGAAGLTVAAEAEINKRVAGIFISGKFFFRTDERRAEVFLPTQGIPQ